MTTTTLELTCRDPIVSRDGRPFGAGQGNRMRAVGWPLPSVVAGSLRTAIGKTATKTFSTAVAQELLQVAVAGVLPVSKGQLYLPAPYDSIILQEQGPLRLTPQLVADGGCDWPADGLRPVMLSEDQVSEEIKPKEGPAWWPLDRCVDWLIGTNIPFDTSFLHPALREERTHVQIDTDTGAADEGTLFTTAALPLTHLARYGAAPKAPFNDRFAEIILAARVNASGWCGATAGQLNALHPLGGERRLVHWKTAAANVWACPKVVGEALAKTNRVRMVLTTPAIFDDGWKPGWLKERLIGSPPGSNVTLKLVGVTLQRWRAVSGWSLAELPNQPRGPKPVKRLVPAGGVYFFEIESGASADLAGLWLEPVSDDEQDRRDGFGLSVWGTW